MKKILEQFKVGLDAGYKYFYLVGRDLGSYGYDMDLTLADLLNKIDERYSDRDYNLYLANLSPNSLIDLYPEINPPFLSRKAFELGSHIQSGSQKILKLMGKTFSFYDWIAIMKDIDKNYPKIRTHTSIIVGFPGETEDDFHETLNLLNRILFDRIDVYKYEERPNLPSLKLKERIPEEIKKRRYDKTRVLATLNNLKKRIKRAKVFY
jgi:tRNA A37 methylthiotransferase MiaB